MHELYTCQKCRQTLPGQQMKDPRLCWACSRDRYMHGLSETAPNTADATKQLFLFTTSPALQYVLSRAENHATIIGARKSALAWANELGKPIWIYRLKLAESIVPVPLPPLQVLPQKALPGYAAGTKGSP